MTCAETTPLRLPIPGARRSIVTVSDAIAEAWQKTSCAVTMAKHIAIAV